MFTTIMKLLRNEDGATAIEYGLIAALIAVAAVTVMGTVGTNLSSTFNTVATTSSSVGKRPVCFLEYFSTPSTVMSSTPATPGTNSTSAPYFCCNNALARRARGS